METGVADAIPAREASEDTWRRFAVSTVSVAALVILGLVSLNFLVNPAGYYPSHLLPRLTANDIVEKRALLRSASPPPSLLILGSSRAMQLPPAFAERLTGLPSFNAATSAGEPRDMLEILHYAVDDLGLRPKMVVIAVDLEMFHNGQHYTAHLPPLSERSAMLLSPEMSSQSARSLRYWLAGAYPHPTRRMDPDGLLHDLRLEDAERHGNLDTKREMQDLLNLYLPVWRTYSGLSKEQLYDLDEIQALCRKYGIKEVAFLTPRSSALEEALRPFGYQQRLDELRAVFFAVCRQGSAQCYDFSTPKAFKGEDNGFYDGVHVTKQNAELILTNALGAKNAF